MKTVLFSATLAGVLWATGGTTSAAPLQRADVAGDAAWVLHLDCDALRPTAVGQYIEAEMNKPENQAKLAIFQSIFNIDLRTQLHGATLFGPGAKPEDGVLLLYADFDPAKLVSLAQAAKDSRSTAHGSRTIYSWIDEKKPVHDGVPPRTYAAIQGQHVIFSQTEQAVARALDVAASPARSLASSTSFPGLGASAHTPVIEGAAQKMNLPDSSPNAAILKMSQSIQLMIGERQKQCVGKLTLVADSAEVAGHIASIAQGLLALGRLQADKPDSAKLANAVSIHQEGATVTLDLTLPAGDVVGMMKADAARKAAGKDKGGA